MSGEKELLSVRVRTRHLLFPVILLAHLLIIAVLLWIRGAKLEADVKSVPMRTGTWYPHSQGREFPPRLPRQSGPLGAIMQSRALTWRLPTAAAPRW